MYSSTTFHIIYFFVSWRVLGHNSFKTREYRCLLSHAHINLEAYDGSTIWRPRTGRSPIKFIQSNSISDSKINLLYLCSCAASPIRRIKLRDRLMSRPLAITLIPPIDHRTCDSSPGLTCFRGYHWRRSLERPMLKARLPIQSMMRWEF